MHRPRPAKPARFPCSRRTSGSCVSKTFDIWISPGRQGDPDLVREAARTKTMKDEASASFKQAHAATARTEKQHELSLAALTERQTEERRLRH